MGRVSLHGGEREAPFAFGAYVGNGAETRKIKIGFKPSFLLLSTDEGIMYLEPTGYYGGYVTPDFPAVAPNGNEHISLLDDGFEVYCKTFYWAERNYYLYTNYSNKRYFYIAFR